MKILLVSDFGLDLSPGGAQRSNQIIIDEGIKRGHDIYTYHINSHYAKNHKGENLHEAIIIPHKDVDFVISSNLEQFSQMMPHLVQEMTWIPNMVRLEHDSNLYWDNEFRKAFWGNAKMSFFLTNFHHQFFVESYGDIFPNVKIVPDPIDPVFTNYNQERRDVTGYVGFFHPLKGTDGFIAYAVNNPNTQFEVAGWGNSHYESMMNLLPNVNFLGKVEYEEMPKFFNSISKLYYNPECNEPFCRTVGEALLCGVDIVGDSDRIGSLHMFNEDPENFRDKCLNAATTFWETLEQL